MKTSDERGLPDRAPVILVRTGREEVAAFAPEGRPGWHRGLPLVHDVTGRLGDAFGGGSADPHGRYFRMPADQLDAWDAMKHHGNGNGYTHAVGWREDGKIGKMFSVKEVKGAPVGCPAPDPLALANVLAIAQLQSSIDRLTTLLESVASDVKTVLVFLRTEQEAAILAAVETIDDIYSAVQTEGRITNTDWERIYGLEQVLKQQHRQVLAERRDIAAALGFRDIHAARTSLDLDPERVRNLVTLEHYRLRAFHRWAELMLGWRAASGHSSASSVTAARDTAARYTEEAVAALEAVRAADTDELAWRGVLEMLFDDGIWMGLRHDRETEDDAKTNRDQIRTATESDLDRALPQPRACLRLVAA